MEINPVEQKKLVEFEFESVGSVGGNQTANLEKAFRMIAELAPVEESTPDLKIMLRNPTHQYDVQTLTITRTEENGGQFSFLESKSDMEGGKTTIVIFSFPSSSGSSSNSESDGTDVFPLKAPPSSVLLLAPAEASGEPEGLAQSVADKFETLLKGRLIDDPQITVSPLTEEEVEEKRKEWAKVQWSSIKGKGIMEFSVDYIVETTLILE
jgi:hypothetical protein